MSAYAESYDAEESSFEDFDATDELSLPSFLRPGKKVSVPGAGLLSATLNTPKGPAKLSLPTPVPTQTQFRQLESALNAQTQRLNAVQSEVAKMRRELVLRRQAQGSSGMMSMLLPLLMQKKLKDDFLGHTHAALNAPPVLSASSGDALSSLLPLLLLSPGLLGGSSSTNGSSREPDISSNPLVMMMLFDVL
jgi:hypothetical protein